MQCLSRQKHRSGESQDEPEPSGFWREPAGFWKLLSFVGCGESKQSASEGGIFGLSYDIRDSPISNGKDKYVFAGTWRPGYLTGSRKVAVIIAKQGREQQMLHEINIFNRIGKHPHIIEMLCDGTDSGGMPLAALEAVEPIGYDMSSLVNQYSWLGQAVPGSLMARLIRQLISALQHMHALNFIHRDLKMQNVLVNAQNDVKLIDLGTVAKIGERGKSKDKYIAPEVCNKDIMTEKVDCWGVGVILHQAYQKRIDLLHYHGNPVQMRRGMPSSEHPMAKDVWDVMCGLLQLDTERRWSLDQVLESPWMDTKDSLDLGKMMSFSAPSPARHVSRRYLRKYSNSITTYAARIGPRQKDLIGKKLIELDFVRQNNITIILIAHLDSEYERVPGKDTILKSGTWVYFGIRSDDSRHDDEITPTLTAVCQTLYGKNFDPKDKVRDVSGAGRLVAFTLEFDCFVFPDRGHKEYVLGTNAGPGQEALNLRETCNLNIAGVVSQSHGEIWFPRADQVVRPGDLGLVVRAPRSDGLSDPTVRDEDLDKLHEIETQSKME